MSTLTAAIFEGGGIRAGLSALLGLRGVSTAAPLDFVLNVLSTALTYVSLLAFIAIVVAGFYLIGGFGSEEAKERAKRIITYTAIGLLVIYFAHTIVSFFATAGVDQVGIRGPVLTAMNTVLSYLGLLAMIMIIGAGVYLIVGFGSDDSKEKAKKVITYTIVGLLLILFARLIVLFFLTFAVS